MSRRAVLCGTALLLLTTSVARAGNPIRVAIEGPSPSILIQNVEGIFFKRPGGQTLARIPETDVATVAWTEAGMAINGVPVAGSRVIAVPRRGELTVGEMRLRGVVEFNRAPEGIWAINILDLEEYLRGVVPTEMAADWPEEALRAQAVVARTYALYQKEHNQGRPYDLWASVMDQAYRGRMKEDPRATAAVGDTEGVFATFGGGPILAAYHASSGGPTADVRDVWGIDLPYLRGVACPYDDNAPSAHWERRLSLERLESALGPAVVLGSLTPYRRDAAGRVRTVRILDSEAERLITGNELRRLLGYSELPSALFEVIEIGREIVFTGRGAGHGVGMCQWGARAMAEQGASYPEIIRFYYPGVELARLR